MRTPTSKKISFSQYKRVSPSSEDAHEKCDPIVPDCSSREKIIQNMNDEGLGGHFR